MQKLVLGIESSCDESAVALVVTSDSTPPTVLAEEISSQAALHELYGGVVPELASREHLQALPLLLETVLTRAGIKLDDIDGVGVTQGPGLVGCLLVGMNFARGICSPRGIPLYGVHHIEGHVLAPLLEADALTFPYLALVVSGGHTEIHLVHELGSYQLLSRTMDDAAGEAFDKAANLLGLGYPGGAKLAALADAEVGEPLYRLPAPVPGQATFSFSGLKTAISLLIQQQGGLVEARRGALAHAIQSAIVSSLTDKLQLAVRNNSVETIVVTGGVSANHALRRRVNELFPKHRVVFPPLHHCTDNAAMIALCAGMRLVRNIPPALGEPCSRWPLELLKLRTVMHG